MCSLSVGIEQLPHPGLREPARSCGLARRADGGRRRDAGDRVLRPLAPLPGGRDACGRSPAVRPLLPVRARGAQRDAGGPGGVRGHARRQAASLRRGTVVRGRDRRGAGGRQRMGDRRGRTRPDRVRGQRPPRQGDPCPLQRGARQTHRRDRRATWSSRGIATGGSAPSRASSRRQRELIVTSHGSGFAMSCSVERVGVRRSRRSGFFGRRNLPRKTFLSADVSTGPVRCMAHPAGPGGAGIASAVVPDLVFRRDRLEPMPDLIQGRASTQSQS